MSLKELHTNFNDYSDGEFIILERQFWKPIL